MATESSSPSPSHPTPAALTVTVAAPSTTADPNHPDDDDDHDHLHHPQQQHQQQQQQQTPTATVVVAAAVRKFPAPCWTQEETMELINAYKDKWYSLRCRNLRSADWDAVAADVNARCPPNTAAPSQDPDAGSVTTATPGVSTGLPKTSAQCRHKMEKLRKRYRTEKQRALNHPNRFFASSWVFFDLMDAMETGSCLNGGAAGSAAAKSLKKGGQQVDIVVSTDHHHHNHNQGFDNKFTATPLSHSHSQGLVGSTSNKTGTTTNPRDLGSSVPIKFKFKTHHGSSLGYDDAARFDRHLEAEEDETYAYDSHSHSHSHSHSLRDYALKQQPPLLHHASRSSAAAAALFDRKLHSKVADDDDDDDDFFDQHHPRFDSRVSNNNGSAPPPPPGGKRTTTTSTARAGGKRGFGINGPDSDPLPSSSRDSVVGEMVRSIRMLGDGFVRMEKMKADMVREIERMRMEMEMKRSEMILESQQLIVNAFVDGLLAGDKKKNKKPKLASD